MADAGLTFPILGTGRTNAVVAVAVAVDAAAAAAAAAADAATAVSTRMRSLRARAAWGTRGPGAAAITVTAMVCVYRTHFQMILHFHNRIKSAKRLIGNRQAIGVRSPESGVRSQPAVAGSQPPASRSPISLSTPQAEPSRAARRRPLCVCSLPSARTGRLGTSQLRKGLAPGMADARSGFASVRDDAFARAVKVVEDVLASRTYDSGEATQWASDISSRVVVAVRELDASFKYTGQSAGYPLPAFSSVILVLPGCWLDINEHHNAMLLHFVASPLATCTLVQKADGGMHSASAACWNPTTDGCFTVRWENQTMLAVVVVFAI